METKIDKIIASLLTKIPESEEIDHEFIQNVIEKVRKKLDLGAVYILGRSGEKRDYSFRWISSVGDEYEPERDIIHIKSKEYRDILEACHNDPIYSTVFSGKGIKGDVSTIGYGFVRTATNVLDGVLGFASSTDHQWTDEETNSLRKLGRVLRRILSCEYLHDTDIQLKMASTKVEIYRHYTEYDALTQIPNRHYFVRFCKEFVEKDKRPNVGFLFADLNRLKFINDTMGHPEGDIYITNFAEKLSKCFQNATVCRISGDEFIACTTKDAREDFEKKVEALKNEDIYRGVPQASLGFVWHEQPENIKDIMNEAEALMYTNKQEFYKKYPQYKR